jgi:hypothetical protein
VRSEAGALPDVGAGAAGVTVAAGSAPAAFVAAGFVPVPVGSAPAGSIGSAVAGAGAAGAAASGASAIGAAGDPGAAPDADPGIDPDADPGAAGVVGSGSLSRSEVLVISAPLSRSPAAEAAARGCPSAGDRVDGVRRPPPRSRPCSVRP